MSRSLFLLALAACAQDVPSDTVPVDEDLDPDSEQGTEADSDVVSERSDEATVAALIAGEIGVQDALQSVSDGGGWPVLGADGSFWFVALDDGRPVTLAGDLNDWEPAAMEQGDGFYWLQATVPDPIGSGYKLVRAGSDYAADPWSRHYLFDDFGELSLVQPDPSASHYARFVGVVSGDLLARTVRVRVPAGTGPWPALYVQDGQNLFEAGGTFGSWHLEDTAQADGMLIVGIDSTTDRVAEYTHTDDSLRGDPIVGRADEVVVLVRDVVRPRVEATWSTTGHNGLMGSSLGGLVSLYIAQHDPGEWDFVASLSGTLGWGRFEQANPTMQELYVDGADALTDMVVYVDSGGGPGEDGCQDIDGDGFVEDDPDDADNYCTNRAFADRMHQVGFVYEETLWHWAELGAPHSEPAWAARVFRPMQYFLNGNE